MKKNCIFLLLLGILLLAVSCRQDNDPPEGDTDGDTDVDTEITAMAAVRDMKLGVNIGNTYDSLDSGRIAGPTGWGNPEVSQGYIRALKDHGFTTVRFPVSWSDYIGPGPDYTVNEPWMAQIERVVRLILVEDMYCILNVHHDGADIVNKSWIEDAPNNEAEVKAKYTALWDQIANRFNTIASISPERNGRLVFESLNEPQFDKLWPRNNPNVENKTKAFRLLTDLNQIFVDTVRATGGNNAARFLLISSYWTDIDMNVNNWGTFFFMPTDTVPNKLILSFHYYTPWNFCGGNSITWGTENEINSLNNQFNKVKTNFINKGIPVILGEYAVNINTNNGNVNANPKNPANRLDWMLRVTQACVNLGICPVLWDTGMRNNNKGMADVQRQSPFDITDNLRDMISGVVWPAP